MDRYLVIHEYTCPACNGDKVLDNPDWAEANAAYDAAHETTTQRLLEAQAEPYDCHSAAIDAAWKAMTDYWIDHGYSHDQKTWPQEAERCHECEGFGTIRKEVDLATALEAIQQAGR